VSYPVDIQVPDLVRCQVCNLTIRIPVRGTHSAGIRPSAHIGAVATYPCHKCNGTVDLFVRDDGRISGARYRDVKDKKQPAKLSEVIVNGA